MNQDNSVVLQQKTSLLATHAVLRNTYLLLSLTLLFSAFTAWLAMSSNAAPIHPLLFVIGTFGLMMVINALSNSAMGIVAVFAFTGFMGWTLGPILNMYIAAFSNGGEIIMTAVGGTGVIFLALSGYVLVTQRDFSYLGGFLFIGLIVMMIGFLASFFFHMPMLQLVISAGSILIAAGLILFDTSRIINNGERNYILATVQLYMDIYMLFINLLNILGALSGERR